MLAKHIQTKFWLTFLFPYTIYFLVHRIAGERGLEVCCNGIGSSLFMDFHIGRFGWYGWHYITGAHTLRWPNTYRSKMFRIRGRCIAWQSMSWPIACPNNPLLHRFVRIHLHTHDDKTNEFTTKCAYHGNFSMEQSSHKISENCTVCVFLAFCRKKHVAFYGRGSRQQHNIYLKIRFYCLVMRPQNNKIKLKKIECCFM